jgi:hypothetical protein
MKLARDSWLLVVVPAGVLLGGAWWVIASEGAPGVAPGPVRFELSVPGDSASAASRANVKASADAKEVADSTSDGGETLAATTPERGPEATPWGFWNGRVVGRDGMPIEGATVVIIATRNIKLGDDTTLGDSERITAIVGKNGELVFEMKPGFRYELEVRAPGFGLEKYEVHGHAGHDLVLDRASTVEGRVVAKGTNEPLAGATVKFQNGNERYVTTTRADGTFTFEGVGARPAHVTVTDNRFVARTQAVENLIPGGSVSFDLGVEPGAPLWGEVLSDGSMQPMGEMAVSLVDRLTHDVVASTTTDASGRFGFRALIPQREYYVSISGFGFRMDRPALVGSLGGAATYTVVTTWSLGLQLSNQSGLVAGANVILRRQDGLALRPGVSSVSAVSNGQGFVAFNESLSRDLAYRVVIQHPGSATMELGPITSQGGVQVLAVSLIPARSLSGHVVDSFGAPVAFATVRAHRLDGYPAPSLFVQADANGAFAFDCLAPGTISLVTFRAGYDNTRKSVEIPAEGPAPVVDLVMPALQANGSPNGNLFGQ